jgi:hypothetical protein
VTRLPGIVEDERGRRAHPHTPDADITTTADSCMGMSFGYDMAAPRDEETSLSVIRQAIDGMTLIDTADIYGPCTNEELIAAPWPVATASERYWPPRSR